MGEPADRRHDRQNPGWYRRLSRPKRTQLSQRFWAEGRLKLEPWLASRVQRPAITLWPQHTPRRLPKRPTAASRSRSTAWMAHAWSRSIAIVLATGYKVDITRVPLLARGNLLPRLQTDNGVPVLDE